MRRREFITLLGGTAARRARAAAGANATDRGCLGHNTRQGDLRFAAPFPVPARHVSRQRCQGVKESRLIEQARLWRPHARLPPALLLATGKDPLLLGIPHRNSRQRRCCREHRPRAKKFSGILRISVRWSRRSRLEDPKVFDTPPPGTSDLIQSGSFVFNFAILRTNAVTCSCPPGMPARFVICCLLVRKPVASL